MTAWKSNELGETCDRCAKERNKKMKIVHKKELTIPLKDIEIGGYFRIPTLLNDETIYDRFFRKTTLEEIPAEGCEGLAYIEVLEVTEWNTFIQKIPSDTLVIELDVVLHAKDK